MVRSAVLLGAHRQSTDRCGPSPKGINVNKLATTSSILLLAAVGLVGCGSDESSDSAESTVAPAESSTLTDVASTESGSTDVASTDVVSTDGSGASDGEASEFCLALEELNESSPADQQTFADGFVDLADAAPDEVSDATATLRDFFMAAADAAELPAGEVEAALEELSVREAEFTEATEQIEEYARANCDNLGEDFYGTE